MVMSCFNYHTLSSSPSSFIIIALTHSRDLELVTFLQIALAKVSWMEEHANLREDALRDLSKKKEEEFTNRYDCLSLYHPSPKGSKAEENGFGFRL